MIPTSDIILITGRFTILHVGHCELISKALQSANTGVVINFGSSQEYRTQKNPFTVGERMEMMAEFFEEDIIQNRLLFTAISDTPDLKSWVQQVYSHSFDACKEAWKVSMLHSELSYAVWSSDKGEDGTLRQDWFAGMCPVRVVKTAYHDVHATDLRQAYFKHGIVDHPHIPKAVQGFLTQFKTDPNYNYIKQTHFSNQESV